MQLPAGGTCSSPTSCVTHSSCEESSDGSKCTCLDGFVPDDITGLCKQAAKEKCSSSKSCVTHSLCTGNDEDKTCSCFGGFVADDATGLCKMPSGGKCSSSALCVTHSICSENDGESKCSCFDDFVADDATGLCKVGFGEERGTWSAGIIFAVLLAIFLGGFGVGFVIHACIYRPDQILGAKRKLGIGRTSSQGIDVFKRFMYDAFALIKDSKRHTNLDMVDGEEWMLQNLGAQSDSEDSEKDTEDESSSTDWIWLNYSQSDMTIH
ncbi:unnamed protein product [Darwinula stevensoni]|uniref:Uncharacterized protein n=1 Tax=Darwinula stevensoni TaxID=69355 RepID=A0A7R9A264_9CRUS|nr:unnamed protein product [Darwinula stevensoni]CAG0885039.1 unnamed protein product [Darwinula stevensoni]